MSSWSLFIFLSNFNCLTTFLDYSSLENTDEQKGIKIKFDFHNQTTLRYIITLKISVYTSRHAVMNVCVLSTIMN